MPCFPGYRYCGPWCSGPGAPVNQLDALCMEHDACYRKFGSKRMCDKMFLERLRPWMHHPGRIGRDARLMEMAMRFKTMW
ncbi:Parvovirus coat protein VP1-like protein [Halobacillus hunanensis]|uniref:Parvovirus coat protein VP1-like protein n=1 Tax=Halobacillus hunanensis TaxID=578214 RepID=UPI0009A5A9C3|nr:Parvovirus coat protein VP1-like protein [Halobacillus hunanensis]